MDIKKYIHSQIARKILCVILIAAIGLGMGIPGHNLHSVAPQTPPPGSDEQILEMLSLGDNSHREEVTDEADEDADKGGLSDKEDEEQDKETDEQDQKQEENDKPEQDTEESDQDSEEDKPEQDTEESDQDSEEDKPAPGDGDSSQEDGPEGEEGGEQTNLALSSVMTWYKYGKEPKNIVCGPSSIVTASVNTAQLTDDDLKYDFSLAGDESSKAKITSVSVKEGDGPYMTVDQKGKQHIELPTESSTRMYTFQVQALWKAKDAKGKSVEQEVTFTYQINCYYALDLELELSWKQKQDQDGKLTCIANKTVSKTLESNKLEKKQFIYTPTLTGKLVNDAKITDASYQTASGEAGSLQAEGGTLVLHAGGKEKKETYYLTFTVQVKDEDGHLQTVYYRFTIAYVERKAIDLSFTWLEKGMSPRTLICQPDAMVTTDLNNNQLSAGAVKYEIQLTGEESEGARILSITYQADSGTKGDLAASGALPMILPVGRSENTYTISVVALSEGKKLYYTVKLRYVMDVALEMTYTVKENGTTLQRIVLCENGKTKTAEAIYDDQLTEGKLNYVMTTTGSEKLTITSVKCYQAGSGRMVNLQASGQLTLLLDHGKTGENTFKIKALDKMGTEYTFNILVPYKHRGENIIKISTNMINGQTIINETKTNFNVSAWSEDENGKVVSYIPANGEDTKLIVKLDGEILQYVSTSGPASEFILYPSNPKKGDKNTHTIYIYAEDPYGNYGELTLTLNGQRKQSGQKKGTARIYIDMTVLGMGIVDTLSYDVLSDEPISYSVAKAVMGKDTGDPFGAAKHNLGWGGRYTGTLDVGFYLQSLTPGLPADALDESSWNKLGRNEEEVLQAIDDRFGKGTGLATLWRCIYRNGLNKSSGSDGSYSEFDFTSGSGWLFSLDGTYYPGLAMSEYSLEDGDVLTLRYTLAHGWDVGGGTKGYGNTVGYCVTALDGKYYIQHQMEEQTKADGSKCYVCHCCGLEEGCRHENTTSKNLGDGTHVAYCSDCLTEIGSPELHSWTQNAGSHNCAACGAGGEHDWKEVDGTNTATCTAAGNRTVCCTVCSMTKEEDSPAKGHKLNSRWNHTETEHYQKCSVCFEVIAESQGIHQYEYHAGDDDWYCKVCDAGHDWDYCGNGDNLVIIPEETTCNHAVYQCSGCGLRLEKDGVFEEYHNFAEGACIHCSMPDPSTPPPEENIE